MASVGVPVPLRPVSAKYCVLASVAVITMLTNAECDIGTGNSTTMLIVPGRSASASAAASTGIATQPIWLVQAVAITKTPASLPPPCVDADVDGREQACAAACEMKFLGNRCDCA